MSFRFTRQVIDPIIESNETRVSFFVPPNTRPRLKNLANSGGFDKKHSVGEPFVFVNNHTGIISKAKKPISNYLANTSWIKTLVVYRFLFYNRLRFGTCSRITSETPSIDIKHQIVLFCRKDILKTKLNSYNF